MRRYGKAFLTSVIGAMMAVGGMVAPQADDYVVLGNSTDVKQQDTKQTQAPAPAPQSPMQVIRNLLPYSPVRERIRHWEPIWTGRPRPRRPEQMWFIYAKDHAIDSAVRRTARKLAAGSRHGVSRKRVRENLARLTNKENNS